MVRGGQKNQQDSDSDWDSISEAVIPADQNRNRENHNQPGNHEERQQDSTDNSLQSTPINKTLRSYSASVAHDHVIAGKEEPLYSEIIRPRSLDNPRSLNQSQPRSLNPTSPTPPSGGRGPMTFVDQSRRNSTLEDDFEEVNLDIVPDNQPTAIQQTTTTADEVQQRTVTSARQVDLKFKPTVVPAKNSKPKNLQGFDNLAFQGSQPSLKEPSCKDSSQDSYGESCPEMDRKEFSWKENPRTASEIMKTSQRELPQPDETIEIFPFESSSTEFYQVVERRKKPLFEGYNEKLYSKFNHFWSEIFAIAGTPVIIILAFLLQLIRFLTVSLLRPIVLTLISGLSDGFLKPMLSSAHNGIIHPLAVFLYNAAGSLKLVVSPLTDIVAGLLGAATNLVAAFRLVEVRHIHHV